MARPSVIGALVLLLMASLLGAGHAQEEGWDSSAQAVEAQDLGNDEGGNRTRQAETNFDAIMAPQNAPAAPATTGKFKIRRSAGDDRGEADRFIPPQASEKGEPTATVPLAEFQDVRRQIETLREQNAKRQGPAVVLGAAQYTGEAVPGALRLTLLLQVSLGRPGLWKTVPLVGDDVVLVKVSEAGRALPVSRQSGYHVWLTRDTGERTLEIELLVPAQGPRGSIEYDFVVDRTPITRFVCRFPGVGLEPRVVAAAQSETRREGAATVLSATLLPTARIHLVGYRETTAAEGQEAKIYAESLNLLSLEENSQEMFSVIRYTILYAGAKEFNILIPRGYKVKSADGMGAFRVTEEKTEQGTLIKGETAFPIRNHYEISLRLQREAAKVQGSREAGPTRETLQVAVPGCQGVERETGWLGVEVPGKFKLEEGKILGVTRIEDVRELPEDMIRSAVSPILFAYRFHSNQARVELLATRLQAKELASGSIDRIRAFTAVTVEGVVMTDLRITLRNRLRHSLLLAVPRDTEVPSAMLDGEPIKPSWNEQGQLLLPLKRSGGDERLQPFTLSVILKSRIDPLGVFGAATLELPTAELPVSSLGWSVFLPARNSYSRLQSDIEPQGYTGRATWYRPPQAAQVTLPGASPDEEEPLLIGEVSSTTTGAMPVRVKLPKDGIRLNYERYWLEAGVGKEDGGRNRAVLVSFRYLRSWLRIPIWLGLILGLGIGLWLLSARVRVLPTPAARSLGAALTILSAWPLLAFGGWGALLFALISVGVVWLIARGLSSKHRTALGEWLRTLPQRFRARSRDPKVWRSPRWVFGKILLSLGLCYIVLVALDLAFQIFLMLLHPL